MTAPVSIPLRKICCADFIGINLAVVVELTYLNKLDLGAAPVSCI